MLNYLRMWKKRAKRSLEGCRLKPSLGLIKFEEGFDADLLGFLIPLPFLDRFHTEPIEMLDRWGIYYSHASIVLNWGNWSKFIHMPWTWEHLSSEVLRADGTWVKEVPCYEKNSAPDGRLYEDFEYHYVLKSGEVQKRVATVHTSRMTWVWRWCPGLRWLREFRWPILVRKSIDIRFNDEVGERTGSWKGGCIGCGYDMRPGETVEQTLRRMESERKFD